MYIDKIYTKLYSDKDWNGLEQLVSEIKSFSMSLRDGIALNTKIRLAREGKLKRPYDSHNPTNDKVLDMVANEKLPWLPQSKSPKKIERDLIEAHDPSVPDSMLWGGDNSITEAFKDLIKGGDTYYKNTYKDELRKAKARRRNEK